MYRHTDTHESRWRGCGFKRFLSLLAPAIAALSVSASVALGETPNDPLFQLQWGSDNTGQSVPLQEAEEILGPPSPGAPGDDDGALKAWGLTTGSRSIVIGETDTGVDYTHPDLAANIWSNPGGIGSCSAGTHGYNVLTQTCDPMDNDTTYGGHGTHVAGIMGAIGNNEVGIAGMNWQTTILPVKWLNSASSGETSGLIEALQWLVAAKQAGVNVRVVNDSPTFIGTGPSPELKREIEVLGENNILFVTAAGNSGSDNDEATVRRYPCGYDLPNEICVTASDDDDRLPNWANYGPNTVDLAAPGVSVYSTLRGPEEYGYLSGGSMAAPQVAGAAALILSVDPTLSATELKADILNNVDRLPSLADKVITGGRLDVCKALPGCERVAPGPVNTEAPQGSSQSTLPSTATPVTTQSSVIVIATTTFTIHSGRAAIKLRCRGLETCSSGLMLTVKMKGTKGQGKKNTAKTKTTTIGTATFSIPAGKTTTVAVKLNATGRVLLSAAYGHLSADLTILKSSSVPTGTQTKHVHLVSRKATKEQRPK